jgi:exportin-2 (importin alpha re-exporter)
MLLRVSFLCCCFFPCPGKYEDQFAEFVQGFVSCIFTVLSSLSVARRYDQLVGSSVRFLTAVVKKAQFHQLFASEQALNTLADKVIVPQLRLRESDLESFDMNPQEYIRVDIEGSDADTRRRNTVDLINGLVGAFEAPVSAILKRYVETMLAEYARAPKTETGMLAKDCAMYITLALSAKSQCWEGAFRLMLAYLRWTCFLLHTSADVFPVVCFSILCCSFQAAVRRRV